MWKTIRHLVRSALVWTVIASLSLNVAFAGRVIGKRRLRKACIYSPHAVPQKGKQDGTVAQGELLDGDLPPAPEMDLSSPSDHSAPDPGVVTPLTPRVDPPRPAEPEREADPDPVPEAPQTQDEPPQLPMPEPRTEPAPDPLDRLFDEPDAAPDTTPEAPAEPSDAPSDPLNELFDDSTPEAPGEAPADEVPADPLDGLFDSPADEMPAPGGEAPAGDPLDELFDDPDESASTADRDPWLLTLEDRFGGPATAVNAPADEVDEPVLTPVTTNETPVLQTDQRVGEERGDRGVALDANASEARSVEPSLPGSLGTAVEREPLPPRHWVDDSGLYSVDGRLIDILDGRVRIMKSSGRSCTVVLNRLSQRDVEYVRSIQQQFTPTERPSEQ